MSRIKFRKQKCPTAAGQTEVQTQLLSLIQVQQDDRSSWGGESRVVGPDKDVMVPDPTPKKTKSDP